MSRDRFRRHLGRSRDRSFEPPHLQYLHTSRQIFRSWLLPPELVAPRQLHWRRPCKAVRFVFSSYFSVRLRRVGRRDNGRIASQSCSLGLTKSEDAAANKLNRIITWKYNPIAFVVCLSCSCRVFLTTLRRSFHPDFVIPPSFSLTLVPSFSEFFLFNRDPLCLKESSQAQSPFSSR